MLRTSIAAIAVVSVASFPVSGASPCLADLTGDGMVDGADLGLLLGDWGRCAGCSGDLNADGTVDGADLGLLLGTWGEIAFEFGESYRNAEAWQIGLEMLSGDELALASEDYNRIVTDLDAIRTMETSLANQFHSMAWAPNQILAAVKNGVPIDEFTCLNDYFGLVSQQFLFQSGGAKWYTLTFASKFNAEAMSSIYAALAEVTIAEPNGLIGGQNFWTPVDNGDGTWTWTIDDGFLDCFDGCDCHKVYTFETDGKGGAKLVNFQQFGQSWCDF